MQLKRFQQLANRSQFVDKTRRTHCTYKRGAIMVTEHRLFIWFNGDKNSWLMKENWLTGDDKADLANLFKKWLRA